LTWWCCFWSCGANKIIIAWSKGSGWHVNVGATPCRQVGEEDSYSNYEPSKPTLSDFSILSLNFRQPLKNATKKPSLLQLRFQLLFNYKPSQKLQI
jgi:hypothetical protein